VDVIVANHLVNDVEDIAPLFTEFARILRPSGRAVILCLHPSFYWARRGLDEGDGTWPDRYFETEPRVQSFNVAGIQSPHAVKAWYRPLEDYGTALSNAGLVITNLSEPHPTPEQRRDPWWQTGWTKPMFLLISATIA
jgi:SAM-dependent methyltransferase